MCFIIIHNYADVVLRMQSLAPAHKRSCGLSVAAIELPSLGTLSVL